MKAPPLHEELVDDLWDRFWMTQHRPSAIQARRGFAAEVAKLRDAQWQDYVLALEAKAAKYDLFATPEIHDFLLAVEREALHQRNIHTQKGDAGKSDADWFWLLGYLGGKALHSGGAEKSAAAVGNSPMARQYYEKQLHHIITTAAACLNWHAARTGHYKDMRPGIAAPKETS